MVSIIEYVQTQLRRGYPPESIRTALIQAGYNPQDVDYALRVNARVVPRHIELTGRNLALILGGMLTLALLLFSGFLLFAPGTKDIQLGLRVEQPNLFPGDDIMLAVTLTSLQNKKVPVTLEYLLLDSSTRRTITRRQETLMVGESALSTETISLPDTIAPGEYEVRLTASFEGLTRVQTARFTVQQPSAVVAEQETPAEMPTELECPASCDDLNPTTEDTCLRGSCIHTLRSDVCGNLNCEAGETRLDCPEDCGTAQDKTAVVEQAISLATSNTEKAATLCSSLVLPQDSDPCFAAVANASGKSAVCTNLQDSRRRDNCLWDFAIGGEYELCDQLTNKYLQTSCNSFARLTPIENEAEATQREAEEMARQEQQALEEEGYVGKE